MNILVKNLIRMSWNVENLYCLAKRTRFLDLSKKTMYQQMWYSKKDIRAYHGGHMTEKQFKSTWKTEPLPVYGLHSSSKSDPTATATATATLPPMQTLTMAPLERRADIVIFRSCFAPSIYSARQLVSHGHVTVNGKKIDRPSYPMKDGDLLSVDPSKIPMLYPKESEASSPHTLPRTFVPRPFQQPWMFIPEYLEVNFNTCSTVFLRSPKVHVGRCEIPSPFPAEAHALAHEFYNKMT
ncbi:mitochondrial 37S ribosomal protein nam9 [Coelomomyces lativittatus]|nr:mitochondrial 37S ribosomal protein nam9 [Coelomomyces lativittatus]